MLKVLRIILSIIVVVLAGFMLLTQNFAFMSYLMLLLGVSVLLTGALELKKDKYSFMGYLNIFAALFAFYVSIQGFLLG
ncbi:DUF3953 domain-containing protein [Alkalihalobacterium chitinilyticum]|uniref:DUF3953 domain-containing protein n=1 Tax=Alkalihalobacterium chitinilyticum TaxID=2980103 RepID=A0ABT5VL60_9BACI|nr:DUF3953 domain-containing protein [Alkalihalobacterium chitinilyticum]MDE5416166.1 DUF3953 domain-containing protein [Alkalihalobacterium chitinilyticum]